MGIQELTQGLRQLTLGAGLRDARGQAVEADQIGQHAQEVAVQQVAALGKDGIQAVTAPLEPTAASAWCLHRKRHFRGRRDDPEPGKQIDQLWVGPVVVDQESGVDSVRDWSRIGVRERQRDIDTVGVTSEIVACLQHGDMSHRGKCVRCSQPRNAGPNHGDRGTCRRHAMPLEYKKAAKRPETKKGGREEEKNRPGITAGRQASGRLRSM